MDPFSITVGSLTLLQAVKPLYDFALDAYHAKEQQKEIKKVFERLNLRLERLVALEKEAAREPDDPRHRSFIAVLKSSKQSTPGKVEPDPQGREPGASQRLQDDMVRMLAKMNPKSKREIISQQFLWHNKKDKFQELVQQINEWIATIESIIILDIQVDTNDRVRNIEIRMKKADLEKEKKANEKRKLALVRWLSPLMFREWQSALLIESPTALKRPRLLDTEEFDAWVKGRPWILHCQGKPGAGKVCV